MDKFLPMTREEMLARDWHYVDFLLISGDAYVDHPSFGAALIGRLLESKGYRVGIVAQPDWRSTEDFLEFGPPRVAILITGGNLDSMVNHYTAARKPRSKDVYSPGGQAGLRPDRATIVYSQRAREAFKGKPVIIGGIEASLRRFAHFDYWDNKVRKSILVDSQADILVYGMGEKQILEIAKCLRKGKSPADLKNIPGTVVMTDNEEDLAAWPGHVIIPSFKEVSTNKPKYAEAFMSQYREQDAFRGHVLVQPHVNKFVVQNPPAKPLSQEEMDEVYALPFQRTYHPSYQEKGGVPALQEVEFSLTANRGCYGGCAFCALTFHQGRIIQSRSQSSLLAEAELMTKLPGFKGYIHDVGGPTANFHKPACKKQLKKGTCPDKQCLFPQPCENLEVDHRDYLNLLRKMRELPGIKKVFVRSGIRYDYLLADKSGEFLRELCAHHVSGQLKVAPEHVSPGVLAMMGKPGRQIFDTFVQKFRDTNRKLGMEQYLVPYFISSHPGSTLKDAIVLAEYIRDMGHNPEQVQDFIPTPGSLSTCMFYTGLDPRTMKKVYVPKTSREKAMQRALLQYRNPKNYELVLQALHQAGREDLIGFGKKCLIRPRQAKQKMDVSTKGKKSTQPRFSRAGKK